MLCTSRPHHRTTRYFGLLPEDAAHVEHITTVTDVQVGGRHKGFDPDVYRRQIAEYQVGKAAALKKAYVGAGNILCHHTTHMPPIKAYSEDMSAAPSVGPSVPASVAGSKSPAHLNIPELARVGDQVA
jgi:tagatose-1,6-bisphosphate aldolase non-catalytic subunit AgaZ/GatZ